MAGLFNPLLFSVKFPSSHKWVSTFFLVSLFGFSAMVFGDLDHVDAQGSSGCDRQTFSLTDCPRMLSEDRGTNNNDNDDKVDGQNIEGKIPSVIPFP
jgi:hypothetical protein